MRDSNHKELTRSNTGDTLLTHEYYVTTLSVVFSKRGAQACLVILVGAPQRCKLIFQPSFIMFHSELTYDCIVGSLKIQNPETNPVLNH